MPKTIQPMKLRIRINRVRGKYVYEFVGTSGRVLCVSEPYEREGHARTSALRFIEGVKEMKAVKEDDFKNRRIENKNKKTAKKKAGKPTKKKAAPKKKTAKKK